MSAFPTLHKNPIRSSSLFRMSSLFNKRWIDAVAYKQESKSAFSAFFGEPKFKSTACLFKLFYVSAGNTTGNFKDIKSENTLLLINRIYPIIIIITLLVCKQRSDRKMREYSPHESVTWRKEFLCESDDLVCKIIFYFFLKVCGLMWDTEPRYEIKLYAP